MTPPPRTALQALARKPTWFLRSAWPWRSLGYLVSGVLLGAVTGTAIRSEVDGAHGVGSADEHDVHYQVLCRRHHRAGELGPG